MRRLRPNRAGASAALLGAALLLGGCTPQVSGAPPAADHTPQAPRPTLMPQAPPAQPPAPLAGLENRVQQAAAQAADVGAEIETAVLDRQTGQLASHGANTPFPIASVVKLFIADDLLLRESEGQIDLSAADFATRR